MTDSRYLITVDNVTIPRKSKRDDFRFAVVIFETTFQRWELKGMRTTKQKGQNLLDSFKGYKKRLLVPVMPS